MSKYYEWDKFKYIYLEDSFVLEIEESEKEISFTIDAVLTEKHPMYSPPRQDEQYCYKNKPMGSDSIEKQVAAGH